MDPNGAPAEGYGTPGAEQYGSGGYIPFPNSWPGQNWTPGHSLQPGINGTPFAAGGTFCVACLVAFS